MYLSYLVAPEDAGKTAETVLRQRLHISGALSRRIRNEQALTADGEFLLNMDRVSPGMLLELRLSDGESHVGPLTSSEPIEICYEDDWLALVNKPPATPTHPRFPGDRGLTTVLSDRQIHPANRLDLDTSGLTLIAKNGYAHHLLTITPIKKIYLGLVHGQMPASGQIDAPIDRAPDSIILRMVRSDGKRAVTHYRTLAYWPKYRASLVAFRLETGRTHQIRVHCQHLGHPLVGDTLYGWEQTFRVESVIRGRNRSNYLLPDKRAFTDPAIARDFQALVLNRELPRQFLHACRLQFTHPLTKVDLDIRAGLTPDLSKILKLLNCSERELCGRMDSLLDLDLPANVRP